MDEEFKYYCLPGIGVDDNSNLCKPLRIVKLPINSLFKFNRDGYNSLTDLRKNDSSWKDYYANDSKSAEKICEEKFVITIADFVLTPLDEEFRKVSFKLLKHTISGELSNDITGIHLYSILNKSIKKIEKLKTEDKHGVWVARIEYYSKRRDRIYTKPNSTMFPLSWDPTTYMFEIQHAYLNRQQCQTFPFKYHSLTKSGIPVEFIIKDGKLRTAYPIYEE